MSAVATVNNSLSAPKRNAHQELSRNQSLATYGLKPAADLTSGRDGDPNALQLDYHLNHQSMLTVASSPYKPGPAGLSALAGKNHSVSGAMLPDRHTTRLATQSPALKNIYLGPRSQRSQSIVSAVGTNSVRSALKLHNQSILR